MKHFFVAVVCFLSIQFSVAQKTDKKLQAKAEELIKGFNGDIGIYIKDLKTGKIVAINADTIFPTASMVKIPILLGIVEKMKKGKFSYLQPPFYKD